MSYYSYAVIGIKVDRDKLYQKSKIVKAFDHNHPETMNFCPDTGKPLWEKVEEPVLAGWDEDGDEFGPYTMITGTEGTPRIVGIVVAEAEVYPGHYNPVHKHKRVEIPNIDVEKQKMKEFLEPLGLWDADQFGLHSILRWNNSNTT